jgi:hypothetical protein
MQPAGLSKDFSDSLQITQCVFVHPLSTGLEADAFLFVHGFLRGLTH